MTDDIDRREFARRLTLGATTVAVATGAEAVAHTADEPKPPSLPVLVLARILKEYPAAQYDEAVLEGILQDVRVDLARGRELSAFPLKNGDEPATVFPADRRSRLLRRPAEAP